MIVASKLILLSSICLSTLESTEKYLTEHSRSVVPEVYTAVFIYHDHELFLTRRKSPTSEGKAGRRHFHLVRWLVLLSSHPASTDQRSCRESAVIPVRLVLRLAVRPTTRVVAGTMPCCQTPPCVLRSTRQESEDTPINRRLPPPALVRGVTSRKEQAPWVHTYKHTCVGKCRGQQMWNLDDSSPLS